MSLEVLDEQLAITLVSRFLNHLEAADFDTISQGKPADSEDSIVKNLLAVGKFLAERQIRWGRKKEAFEAQQPKEAQEEIEQEEGKVTEQLDDSLPVAQSSFPLAVVVLTDKIGKIGRKAKSAAVINAALKLHAALLLSQCLPLDVPEAAEPVLRLCDHVQTAVVGRSQGASEAWKSCLELAKSLSERLCEFVGNEEFVALQVKVAKKVAAGKKDRKLALKIEAVRNPELAAQRKNTENRRKRDVKKVKKAEHSEKKSKSGYKSRK